MIRTAVVACSLVFAFAACQSSATPSTSAAAERPGFRTVVEDGRLWVLRPGQEPTEKCITLVGAGPDGMTLKAVDRETALAYVASRPGFEVVVEDGRVLVTRPGQELGEKSVTKVGAGPRGMSVRAPDAETLQAYLAAVAQS
jgi:hypothetical protein